MNIMTSCARSLAAVAVFAASTAAAYAADGPPLRLEQAIERALTAHPALRRSELAQAASRGERDLLAQATPWELNVEVENIAGTGNVSGISGAETTLGFSKVVERGNKRDRRTALGDANVGLLAIRDQSIRIEVAGNAAKAFIAALAEQRRLEIVEAGRMQAESIRDQVTRRVDVGRAAEAELATAEIALARAGAAVRRSAATQSKKRRQLATALAEDTPSFGQLLGDLDAMPRLGELAALRWRLDTNPELAALTQEQTVLSAELDLARASQHPDLTLGAGVRQLAGPDDTALVVSFSMPLGQKRRASPRIDAARSRQQSVPLMRAQRKRELATELFSLDSDLRAVADEYRLLTENVLPIAEKAVRLYQSGFDRGRYALFELSAAQRTLLEVRSDAVDVAERYQMLYITLQTVLGEVPGQGANP